MIINDYKNHGGRVTVGSDTDYIFKIFEFGYIREMERLREAGFNALKLFNQRQLTALQHSTCTIKLTLFGSAKSKFIHS